MNPRRSKTPSIASNPVLIGSLILLLGVIGVFISYGADRGLPFVPVYQVNVRVPDAVKLAPGDEVRIGGARVGQVAKITAMPGNPVYALLNLHLQKKQLLPIDSTVKVRPRSVLGAKFVAVTLGRSTRNVPEGGTLPLSQAKATVEIDDAFKIFDQATTDGIRGTIQGVGDSVAGRGADINETVGLVAQLLPPLERVARNLLSNQTDVAGFIDGVDAVTAAVAPVVGQLGTLIQNGATTLAALQATRTELGQTIDALPQTESVGTDAFHTATPVLADAASIARAIRPGTRLLRSASNNVARVLEAGVPPLRRAQALADTVDSFSTAINVLSSHGPPALSNSLKELTATVDSLGPTLTIVNPAQIRCNVLGVTLSNLASASSQGDANGSWLTFVGVVGGSMFQSAAPDPALHSDPQPQENAGACQSGNELFGAGQQLSNPPTAGSSVDATSPPAAATTLASGAGLLTPTPGARP
ncbi:MAG: MlaD family protein [Solirubrobacteraceae bacterium]